MCRRVAAARPRSRCRTERVRRLGRPAQRGETGQVSAAAGGPRHVSRKSCRRYCSPGRLCRKALGGSGEHGISCNEVRAQPVQISGGIAMPKPPELTAAQLGDLRRQLLLPRHARPVSQHRNHPYLRSERLGQLSSNPVLRVI
jgi:hypothetical protein